MSTHHFSTHLDGDETVRTVEGQNYDAFYVERGTSGTGLILPHFIPPADRIRFLRELSAAADTLADEIAARETAGAA